MRVASCPFIVMAADIVFVGCSGSNGGPDAGASQGAGGVESYTSATSSSRVPTTGGAAQTSRGRSSGGTSTGDTSPNPGGTKGSLRESGGNDVGGSAQQAGGSDATGGSRAAGGTTFSTGGFRTTGGTTLGSGSSSSRAGSRATGGTSPAAGGAAGAGDAKPSSGCGKTPTLKNSPSTANQNALTVSGKSRQFLVRWPDNYDSNHNYRLILGLHGAGGKATDIGPTYFGLFALSNNSTIFVAPSAEGGFWNVTTDTTFVDEILESVEADLCIDTSRVMLEGFSQGAAMAWNLACSRPGVFRAVVGHSGGGVANPTTCQPIAYLGSLGLSDIGTNSQKTQTDPFATWNGCTIETLPTAPAGSHVCTNYRGCPTADPVRWCSYDGGHTPSPNDSGQKTSWMPAEVWAFLNQF